MRAERESETIPLLVGKSMDPLLPLATGQVAIDARSVRLMLRVCHRTGETTRSHFNNFHKRS